MQPIAITLITLGGLMMLGLVTDLLGRHTPLPRVTLLLVFGFVIGPSGLAWLPEIEPQLFYLLSSIALVRIDEPVLIGAAAQEPRELRSLDAIHLATALSIDGVDVLVTYDLRLAAAATEVGLAVAVPT